MPADRVGLLAMLPDEWRALVRRAGLIPVPLAANGGPADGSPADAVEVLLSARMDEATLARQLAALPSLRWLHVSSAGVDWLDLKALAKRGIALTCGRGLYDIAIAEHVLAAMLAHVKHVHARHDFQRDQLWDQPVKNETLARQCVAIVGFGSIGQEVARLAKAFRMRVEGLKRTKTAARLENVDKVHEPEGLHRMLKGADHVVIAAPLTPATRGLIGATALAVMKPSSSLINISRGALIDEGALVSSLDAGRPGAAYLDVFAEEPLPAGHAWWTHPRVVVTPHSSWESPHLAEQQQELVFKNLERWARHGGELPRARLINRVNLAEGY